LDRNSIYVVFVIAVTILFVVIYYPVLFPVLYYPKTLNCANEPNCQLLRAIWSSNSRITEDVVIILIGFLAFGSAVVTVFGISTLGISIYEKARKRTGNTGRTVSETPHELQQVCAHGVSTKEYCSDCEDDEIARRWNQDLGI